MSKTRYYLAPRSDSCDVLNSLLGPVGFLYRNIYSDQDIGFLIYLWTTNRYICEECDECNIDDYDYIGEFDTIQEAIDTARKKMGL